MSSRMIPTASEQIYICASEKVKLLVDAALEFSTPWSHANEGSAVERTKTIAKAELAASSAVQELPSIK